MSDMTTYKPLLECIDAEWLEVIGRDLEAEVRRHLRGQAEYKHLNGPIKVMDGYLAAKRELSEVLLHEAARQRRENAASVAASTMPGPEVF